jgi:2-polyprenyl-3-methyl-5-hydroxy-6-metoxy-1,4-benzoquinol methylase
MKISSALLDTGYLYSFLKDTLDLYRQGKDLLGSPVAEWGRRTVAAGRWWYGVSAENLEAGVELRLQQIIALYEGIRRDGYTGSTVTLDFGADGFPVVYDGYHRLCILKYLGLVVDVECRVKQDFPLLDLLRVLNDGENLYQPTGDDRTLGWRLWRSDCPKRLGLVADHLLPGDVLDCGCETGYFTRGLTRRGFKVRGVEANAKRVSCARYLSATQNVAAEFVCDTWQNQVANDGEFTNVLLLSVMHHDAVKRGVSQAFSGLELLRGKAKRVIVEFPLQSEGVSWHRGVERWSFTHPELAAELEKATGLKTVKVLECESPNRPLIVLEAKA